jgi:hypothetical protein
LVVVDLVVVGLVVVWCVVDGGGWVTGATGAGAECVVAGEGDTPPLVVVGEALDVVVAW